MITALCGILAHQRRALLEGSVGWIVACVILLGILLAGTAVIWRQPESKTRLTFKVRPVASSSSGGPCGMGRNCFNRSLALAEGAGERDGCSLNCVLPWALSPAFKPS